MTSLQVQPRAIDQQDLRHVVWGLFLAVLHLILIWRLYTCPIYPNDYSEMPEEFNFIFMVSTGLVLNVIVTLGGTARDTCRPLAGFIAFVLWIGLKPRRPPHRETPHRERRRRDGVNFAVKLAKAAIVFWTGFLIEWRMGYCYKIAEATAYYVYADRYGLLR
ncbi:uncharacterized protein F4822DRAFT_278136 [Hypoxylon trugodes]|uniref:uncharacterized protein n=1 Tax=Hypoxylon trugodes TaxID=326681 RepID=UPI00219B5BD7|nr:uncharacterized protein F4822DRAFT_278136 [Hypoxylon trugodes]KAI1387276.1 hypothetical protein F4822DRAFT_278136 [Hypoxylon trugodes]